MTPRFDPGDIAVVLSVPKASGKLRPTFGVGDHVMVAKVSASGAVCVEGHGGYWSAFRFEKVRL